MSYGLRGQVPPEAGITRGQFLFRSALFIGAAVGVKEFFLNGGEGDRAQDLEGHVNTKLFDSEAANDVAGNLLISRSSYWQTETRTMTAILERSDWDKDEQLLPIYPPAVMDYEEDMRKVADELGVPINVVGVVASIESAGKPDADSNIANGLFQVVPSFHRETIDRIAGDNGILTVNDSDRIKALQDPYIGCRVGMEILLEYRDKAIAENSGLDPDSPVIWARALASYNGGPANAGKTYEDMPLESQLYSVHAIRYITDAAIASGLREKGMNDQDIHDAMVSNNVDEDTYAYSQAVDASTSLDSIVDYELIWSTIAGKNKDRHLNDVIRNARRAFEAGKSGYKLPLTPALRIWTAHGGLSLLEQTPENTDPQSYEYK